QAFANCAFGKTKELRKEVLKEKEIKEKDKDKDKELRKDVLKDKEKERKEFKELKEKDTKEVKEFKERETKGVFEHGTDIRNAGTGPQPDVEDRIVALEQAVQQLVHFIGTELRPDLSQSALQDHSQAAKDEKDLKDSEKQSEA